MSPVKQIPIGSIATRAMLVYLTVHFWGGFGRDENISNEVAGKYNTEGNYNKRLIPKDRLKPLWSAVNTVLKTHRRLTLPWSNSGERIISSELVIQYRDEMAKAIRLLDDAGVLFAKEYAELLREKSRSDKSFRVDDYPTPEAIRNRYGAEINYTPIPQGKDLRIDLSNDALSVIQKSINSDQQARVEVAIQNIAERIQQTVGRMIERLKVYSPATKTAKAENTFRDSLVTNIAELADLLPGLNITGDPKIDAMAAELKALATVAPDTLRDDEKQRLKTAKAAQAVLDKVSDFI